VASIAIETNPTKSPKRLMLSSWKMRVRTVMEAVRASRKETEYSFLYCIAKTEAISRIVRGRKRRGVGWDDR
jgi:hypothetical protein